MGPNQKVPHSATRKISTMEPGEERDERVVKDGAGMERSRERSKSSKRPLSSPTDHPRSKLHTSRAQRMTEMTEDLTPGAQVMEPKDKNQNSLPNSEAGPSRSNGF